MLLKRLEYIKQIENETIREFQDRFENLLWQIPRSHHPEDKYLTYLYTNALLVHLGFLLNKKGPKTLHEAHNMAIEIEANISLFKKGHLFTLDSLSLERLISLKTFVDYFQERREKDIDQQGLEEKSFNEGVQSHEEEKEITHASIEDNEDMVKEREPEDIKHDDKVLMCAPPFNEAIQEPISPAQEEEDEASHFPFQVFDDILFSDSKGEEERKSLDKTNPPYYEVEDVETSHDEETTMHAHPSNEVIQILEATSQDEVNTISYFPFQWSDDALIYDMESEEVLE
jgi:hypothetical protein